MSISLREERDSLAVARPFTIEGVASVVEEESVTEICGMEGFSVETVDMTDDALLDRSGRERWPFDAEAGSSVGSAVFCDCCLEALSDAGDMAC